MEKQNPKSNKPSAVRLPPSTPHLPASVRHLPPPAVNPEVRILGTIDDDTDFGIPRAWTEDESDPPPSRIVSSNPAGNSGSRKSVKSLNPAKSGAGVAKKKSVIPERTELLPKVNSSAASKNTIAVPSISGRKSTASTSATARKSAASISATARKSAASNIAMPRKSAASNIAMPRKSAVSNMATTASTSTTGRKSTNIPQQNSQHNEAIIDIEQIELQDEVHIDFHQDEILRHLKVLDNTPRLFFRKHESNPKRLDTLDEKGDLVFQLIDFSSDPELNAGNDINFCLMLPDGVKQLLLIQGSSSFLCLRGELTVSYPGSLPGDKELILGYISQETNFLMTKTKYLIKDSNKEVVYELVDQNKGWLLSPLRKRQSSLFHLMKPKGVPTVYGLIEERSLSTEPGRPSTEFEKSFEKRKSIASASGSRRGSILNKGRASMSRRGSVYDKPVRMSKPTHKDFCIGFKKRLDYKTRTLLIPAHCLTNYDYFGIKKCTRFCVGVSLIVIFIILLCFGIGGIIVLAFVWT